MLFFIECALKWQRINAKKANETGGFNSKKSCFGRTQNSPGNLKILPGVGRLEKIFGKYEVRNLHFRKIEISLGTCPKISGRCSRFSGRLLFTHGSAQTAFVRAFTPRQ